MDSGKKSGKSKSVAKSPSDLDLSGLLRLLSQRYGKKDSLEKVKNTLDKLPISPSYGCKIYNNASAPQNLKDLMVAMVNYGDAAEVLLKNK